MKLVSLLKKLFCSKQEKQKSIDVEATVNKSFLKGNVLQKISSEADYWFLDSEYSVATKKEVERFLSEELTDKEKYVKERHDCDDFMYQLQGNITDANGSLAFGLILGDNHAFNFFVDDKGKVWAVEPQNDKLKPLEEKIDPGKVWMVMI